MAIKVKKYRQIPHFEWLWVERFFTAISTQSEVHKEGGPGKLPSTHFRAYHNKAHNSSLRRRVSAYHRRQNHCEKVMEGLQSALNVQRLIHNWG